MLYVCLVFTCTHVVSVHLFSVLVQLQCLSKLQVVDLIGLPFLFEINIGLLQIHWLVAA
jgi:hypothetical protein